MNSPTAPLTIEQIEHSSLAQADFAEVIGRHASEGMHPAASFAGMFAAAVEHALRHYGPSATIALFYARAALIAQALKSDAELEVGAAQKGGCA